VVARRVGEVGLVLGPSAILTPAGHPAIAGTYSGITALLVITMEFCLQRARDRAFAEAPDVCPRDRVFFEAVKTGNFTPANMDTYLRTTHASGGGTPAPGWRPSDTAPPVDQG
jgi:hypothetical protein